MNPKLPINCPSCEKALSVSQLTCGNCQTSVSGNYALPLLLHMPEEEQNFISDISEKLLASIDMQNMPTDLNLETSELVMLLLFTGISLLFLVWFVILLFNGFKVATNSKGIKHNLLFAGAILLAEILSKILISNLNY